MRSPRTMAFVAVAACAFGFARPADAGVHGWSVARAPFRLSFFANGRLLTSEAPRGRLAYVLGNGATHRVTRVLGEHAVAGGTAFRLATDEAGRTARLTVVRTPRGTRVTWTLLPADGIAQIEEAFTARPGEHFLGGGEQTATVDLRRWISPIKVWAPCRSYAPAPFFLSSAGYGIGASVDAPATLAFPGAIDDSRFGCQWGTTPCAIASAVAFTQLCVKAATLTYEVYAGSPTRILRAHSALVGRPLVPPLDQFALVKWRDGVAGGADLLDDVNELRSRGIPIGWVEIDNPWQAGGCQGSLAFDPARFPDPNGLIDRLHAAGVRVMLWISPEVDLGTPCAAAWPASSLVADTNGLADLDLTAPAVRSDFEQRLTSLFALGIDGVKGDRGDEVDLEHVQLAAGWGEPFHNVYPTLFATTVADALRAAGRQHAATLFRAAYTGSPGIVPGFWAGDQTSDFDGLRAAIEAVETAGLAGVSTIGSDIGGYISSGGPTAEVFVRWAQLGAISPVFEVGGQGANSTFWQLGEQAVDLFRAAAILHYELVPELDALARAAHETGVPVLRPLALEYPADERAWASPLELLVGADLLAAPVDVPRRGEAAAVPVYLPAGSWVDLFSGGPPLEGPRTYTRATPLSQLPLYLRSGSAVRFDLRTPDVWSSPWRTDDLVRSDRSGWLYAPAPGRTDRGGFHAVDDGSRIRLRANGAPGQQVLVLLSGRPRRVVIGSRSTPPSSAAALRSRRSGWLWKPAPFAGVLLKLRSGETAVIDR